MNFNYPFHIDEVRSTGYPISKVTLTSAESKRNYVI